MDKTAQVTVMVENSVLGRGLLAEHGLAFWIEIGGQRVLFYTGQGAVLVGNARELDVPLELADSVVLSHGHFEHTDWSRCYRLHRGSTCMPITRSRPYVS